MVLRQSYERKILRGNNILETCYIDEVYLMNTLAS